eukprot:12234707-Prorocentrum_lima.AAC.1
MARDIPLSHTLEARDTFDAIEAAMGSQEPGRVPDQGAPPLQAQFNFRCNGWMLATNKANDDNQ